MGHPETPSFRLDTAGTVWPYIRTRRLTSYFRIEATLDAPVRLAALIRTVRALRVRYPGFYVYLRRGAFWGYLDSLPEDVLPVVTEDRWPCGGADAAARLLRVKPYRNRIAVECSHALTDGYGAMTYLSALLDRYIREVDAAPSEPMEEPIRDEWEDAFERYANARRPFVEPSDRAFRPRTSLLPTGRYRIISGSIRTDELRMAAKRRDMKIGEYLVAIMTAAIQALEQSRRRNRLVRASAGVIRILVPVDLRRHFPSATLRNFFAYVAPQIVAEEVPYALDEICDEVRWQMRGSLTQRRLAAHFGRHVRARRNLLLRLLPGPLKRLVLVSGFPVAGEARFSASLSNLGRPALSTSAASRVTDLTFIPPPSPYTRTNCSVISFADTTRVTFGSTDRSRALEREFFRLLRRDDVVGRVHGGRT